MRSILIYMILTLITASVAAQTEPTAEPDASPSSSSQIDPHAGVPGAPPLTQFPLVSAQPNPQLAAGTVHVIVVDGQQRPVPQALVVLTMLVGNKAFHKGEAKTGKQGSYTFTGQKIGSGKAYLVTLSHKGAVYRSPLFQLPDENGFEVVIHRLDTTFLDDSLIVSSGLLSVEFNEQTMKVGQQLRVANLGEKTYVFSDKSPVFGMAEGYRAFRFPEMGGDQRIDEFREGGFKVAGSIPPGVTTLVWEYSLPIESDEESLSVELPWRAAAFQVVVAAVPGISLDVSDMPKAQIVDEPTGRYLETQVRLMPDQPPLRRISLSIRGIPGQGKLRWVALILSLVILTTGVVSAVFPLGRAKAREIRNNSDQEKLLNRVEKLERSKESGEIDEDKYRELRADIINKLVNHMQG